MCKLYVVRIQQKCMVWTSVEMFEVRMHRHCWVNNCNELKYDEDHLLSCLPNCGPLERWAMIRLLFFLLLKYVSVTQPLCVTLNCIITMWAMSQICI